MMPGVGFEEMILLVLVAIVVIGPKDLPLMMRKFGRFTGKMRAMAFEFKQGFEELGRQAELEELRKEVANLKKHTGIDDLRREFEEDKRNLESDVHAAMTDTRPTPAQTPQIASPGQPAPGTEPPPATSTAPAINPTHPAAAAAVVAPAPYAGLSADHPGYDTGEDFRLEGHPPETFAPAETDAAEVNGVHVIPDEEVRTPAPPVNVPAKQDTPA